MSTSSGVGIRWDKIASPLVWRAQFWIGAYSMFFERSRKGVNVHSAHLLSDHWRFEPLIKLTGIITPYS